MESAGVSTEGRPLRMLLCAPILQMRLHWNVWSPYLSAWVPHAHNWGVSAGSSGRRSLRFMHMSKIQGASRFDGTLRHIPISGYDVCGESMLGRRCRCSTAVRETSWWVSLWR